MNKKVLVCTLVLFSFFTKAQQQEIPKKEHYKIINTNGEPTLVYEKAMSHTDLDSLRFLNEKRKIPIEGTSLFIELYSANELLAIYKKQISILTIKDPAYARQVKLKLSPDKYSLRVLPLREK